MSITGVPSIASNPRTFRVAPSRATSRTVANPTGLGRSGQREASIPTTGTWARPWGRRWTEHCLISLSQ